MGSDKDKQKEKLEKKRLKQQYKLEKKRQNIRPESTAGTTSKKHMESTAKSKTEAIQTKTEVAKVPWYKNPDWIRALVGIITLIVAIIAIIIGLR